MGEKEEGLTNGPSSGTAAVASGKSYNITKKTCYAFLFLAIAACVIVGLLVYYAGLPDCAGDGSSSNSGSTGGKGDGNGQGKAKKETVTDVRLPLHLIPLAYKVQLTPFIVPDNYTIRGYAEIRMRCDAPGRNVTVHAADLAMMNETIVVEEVGTGKNIPIRKHSYDFDREFHVAHLRSTLEKGKEYVIKIHFTAVLSDSLKGFYRSTYKDANDNERCVCV